ncbi:MAG: response regulator transcription factor [Flavobacteriales bacterium]|jgi:DNA-binding NarL/FixJ family response regulator|nr:response regulator transcription factor [Flavobacteriales bacterium]
MEADDRIPIAVVDDQTLFRQVLADMIDGSERYRVVLQAGDGQEYIEAVQNGVHVAVAVVDLRMPVMDGYETIAWMRANTPSTRALAITFDLTEESMLKAIRAGACGFMLKTVGKRGFNIALDQVATVGRYVDDEQQRWLRENEGERAAFAARREQVLARLTERELEFVRLACHEDELTYDAIAERMNVATRSVHGYRQNVFAKFGIKSKAGLVIFAFKWGLI